MGLNFEAIWIKSPFQFRATAPTASNSIHEASNISCQLRGVLPPARQFRPFWWVWNIVALAIFLMRELAIQTLDPVYIPDPLACFSGLRSNQAWFAFEQQEQRSTTHSPAGHTSGHSGMKSDFCMSETREPEHMKSHFVNCRICRFWACLLRHESGAKRVGKAREAYHFSGDGS